MTDISPQLESFGITPDRIDAHILELRVERDERSYKRGGNAARIGIMMDCLRAMGFEDAKAAGVAHVAWIRERQAAVNALRDLCETFGDNDWPDELYLGDVIEKHLARHLYRKSIK